MTKTTQEVGSPLKVYFYYPAYNKKFVRRTLAGVVQEGKLFVAQAALFPGFKPVLIPVKFRNGKTVYVQDPGMNPDAFDRKEGRRIATERATGNYTTKSGKSYNAPRQTIIEVRIPDDEKDFNPGKFFVEMVESYLVKKGFPQRAAKPKKDNPAPDSTN